MMMMVSKKTNTIRKEGERSRETKSGFFLGVLGGVFSKKKDQKKEKKRKGQTFDQKRDLFFFLYYDEERRLNMSTVDRFFSLYY